MEVAEEAMRELPVGIVSIMDHTQGQGQFRDLEWFRCYWTEDRGADEEEIAAAIAEADLRDYSLTENRVERLSRAAKERGAVFASHDDDTVERGEMLAAIIRPACYRRSSSSRVRGSCRYPSPLASSRAVRLAPPVFPQAW